MSSSADTPLDKGQPQRPYGRSACCLLQPHLSSSSVLAVDVLYVDFPAGQCSAPRCGIYRCTLPFSSTVRNNAWLQPLNPTRLIYLFFSLLLFQIEIKALSWQERKQSFIQLQNSKFQIYHIEREFYIHGVLNLDEIKN